MVKNEMDAEDLLQSSFTDVFTKLNSFNYQASIGAWIKRIVINNCISALKKRERPRETDLENTDPGILAVEPNDDSENPGYPTPEQVNNAIKALPTGCRTIFTLYCMEGYTHPEISEILEVSVGTSKSQYNRARKLLQEALQYEKVWKPI